MLATQRLRSDISLRRHSVLLVPNVGFRHAHGQFLSWCAKRPLDATRRYFADDLTTVRECRSRGQSHLLGDIADTTSGALVTGRVHGISAHDGRTWAVLDAALLDQLIPQCGLLPSPHDASTGCL